MVMHVHTVINRTISEICESDPTKSDGPPLATHCGGDRKDPAAAALAQCADRA